VRFGGCNHRERGGWAVNEMRRGARQTHPSVPHGVSPESGRRHGATRSLRGTVRAPTCERPNSRAEFPHSLAALMPDAHAYLRIGSERSSPTLRATDQSARCTGSKRPIASQRSALEGMLRRHARERVSALRIDGSVCVRVAHRAVTGALNHDSPSRDARTLGATRCGSYFCAGSR
jgi:hypothetical protein